MKKHIFVSLSTFAEYGDEPLQKLKQSGIEYYLNPLGRRVVKEEIIEMGRGATGIVAGVEPYNREILDQLKNLKCISRCGVGTDSIDMDYAARKGIIIRNTPNVVIRPVVELTIAMVFDLMRKISLHSERMHKKKWQKTAGNLLQDKIVGILGLGNIGRNVAETMIKLGAKVIGTDVRPDHEWAANNGVTIVSEESLLKNADILTIHISVHPDTPFILGKDELSIMKKGAWIVNISRGNLIDESALYNALADGHLAGAALDVYSEEPYAGPLCELENTILTPHVATLTKESRLQMETEAVQNLLDTLS